jgi:hypothetical protein
MHTRHLAGSAIALFVVGLGACTSSSSGPATGAEGGPCYGNGTCNPTLMCASNLCVSLGGDAAVDTGTTSDAAAPLDATNTADANDATTTDSADAGRHCADAGAAYVVFLDRAGGGYHAGATDSTTNSTDIINANTTIAAWTVADTTWQTITACVAQKFAPFNIVVTDVDPGTADHAEVVFTAASSIPALQGGASNVADLGCMARTSVKVKNPIAFVNITSVTDPNGICAAVGVAIGNGLGLDTTKACPDAMTLQNASCLTAPFSNTAIACDATALGLATGCACSSGTTQNSLQMMAAAVGLCN